MSNKGKTCPTKGKNCKKVKKVNAKQYKKKMKNKYKDESKNKYKLVNMFSKIPDELVMVIFSLFDSRCSGMIYYHDCDDDDDCCKCHKYKEIKNENYHNVRRCEIRNLMNVCKRFKMSLDTIETDMIAHCCKIGRKVGFVQQMLLANPFDSFDECEQVPKTIKNEVEISMFDFFESSDDSGMKESDASCESSDGKDNDDIPDDVTRDWFFSEYMTSARHALFVLTKATHN